MPVPADSGVGSLIQVAEDLRGEDCWSGAD